MNDSLDRMRLMGLHLLCAAFLLVGQPAVAEEGDASAAPVEQASTTPPDEATTPVEDAVGQAEPMASESPAQSNDTATISAAGDLQSNSIQSLDYVSLQNGKTQIKVMFKNPLQVSPPGYALSNPARIFLDFINTSNDVGSRALNIEEGVLRSLNIVEAGNRTRLVINLAQSVGYETALDGNSLLITLQLSDTARSTSNVTEHFAEAKLEAGQHRVSNVDFRRGSAGEGKVMVDLSDTTTGIDIRTQGKTIVVNFINTSLPRSLERRLDVMDFGTPVQTIDLFAQGSNVRMVIEPKGYWEHSAYQTDRQFIVDVKPIVEDPNKLVKGGKPGYSGEKLSLNFQNVEVRAVLQVIADFTGLNIITSDSVSGTLTLRLKDVPWDQALDIILHSKGLSMRKTGNVVWIAPTDELATKEKLELEARQQIADLEPLRTESFQLNYQKADAFKNLISNKEQKILSRRGSAVVDVRTNIIFIQDTASSLDQVRDLLNKIDVPVRQVMIESRIVIADDRFSKELGVRFGIKDSAGNPQSTQAGISGTLENSSTLATGVTPSGAGDLNVSLPVVGATGQIALTLLRLGTNTLLNLELSALEADKRGKVISNPRVITADQQKATIEQGTEIPYLQASSSGATNVAFKSATLGLAVTPQITPDDKIIMDLEVKKDSVGQVFGGVPSIDTKKVVTQVLVDNGETAVLGGIYEQTQRNDSDKVPILGDLPILGRLFRKDDFQDDKTELLIFITPRILKESLSLR